MNGDPLKWRIYYRDGNTFSNAQGVWEHAPSRRLVGVAWRYGDGPVQAEVGTPYYAHMGDWICRVWDPSLYLRKLGVKVGRWTTNEQFERAWAVCVSEVLGKPCDAGGDLLRGGMICSTSEAVKDDPPFKWIAYYDNGRRAAGLTLDEWNEAPTDGVLAVYYHRIINGVRMAFGRRRLTYYYWKANGDLENLDFTDEVLPDFPQFKHGETAFTARSYTEQGRAIKAALEDTLEDL